MRVAHVLTYISADGAFGGPLAVMSEQTTELARRGHQVEVFAGWDGIADVELPGVDVHLYRTRRLLPVGFSGLVAPGLRRDLLRRRDEFDAVHVHLARDLITTPVAYALRGADGPRLYLQPHGMVKPDGRLRARVLDILVRPALAGAEATFSLTKVDTERLSTVEPRARIVDLPNGVALPTPRQRVSRPRPQVLFLARLQPRKRVLLFADAAHRLLSTGTDADFVIVGPDEGDLPELRRRLAAWGWGERLSYEGSVPPGTGRDRIAQSDIYVLPSVNEPFPMSVLEALSVGTPTVLSSTCHISERLGDAVAIFDDLPDPTEALSEVVAGLLSDDVGRAQLGRRGRAMIETTLSIERVADLLDRYYLPQGARMSAETESGGESAES